MPPTKNPYYMTGVPGHGRWAWRTATPVRKLEHCTAFARVVFYLFPWELKQYPGIMAGIRTIVGEISWPTLRHWRKGTQRPLPIYTARLIEHLEAKLAAGEVLLAELRAEHDARVREIAGRRRGGWAEVRDRDGSGVARDGRGRGGRPKTSV